MLIKKIVVGIVSILVFFSIYLVYHKINQPKNTVKNPVIPISIVSGRYPEFLRDSLNLETKIEDKTIWIYLTNKSSNEFIPSEEAHRSVVCTTELLSDENKSVGIYKEYFKRPPVDMPTEALQIAPNTTEKFGYDLTIPHGIVRVKLTYEDFSATGQTDGGKILIAEKEVKF